MVQPVMTSSEISTEMMVRTLSLQKNVMEEAGQQAVKLIQAAAVLPQEQGQHLDVRG